MQPYADHRPKAASDPNANVSTGGKWSAGTRQAASVAGIARVDAWDDVFE